MKRLSLLLVTVLFLTGCSSGSASPLSHTELLAAPAIVEQRQQQLQAVYQELGEDIILRYPVCDTASSPFLEYDLDDDGKQELLVTYQNSAKSKNVQLGVLQQNAQGDWYAVHLDIEGAAGDTDGIHPVKLKEGKTCFLVGYSDASGQQTLCVYEWSHGALREQTRFLCQYYTVADFNGDGLQQIAMVQENSTYGLLQLRVYGTQGTDKTDEALTEQSVSSLDSRFSRCCFMAVNQPQEGETTLVMDFESEEGNRLGEVMAYKQDRFIRCFTEENVNIPNFTSRTFAQAAPLDVNADGLLELPRVDSRVLGSFSDSRFYFLSWYYIGSGYSTLEGFSFADPDAGYTLLLPAAWRGQVILQEENLGIWSVRGLESGEKFLSFQLTQGRSPGGSYQLCGTLGSRRLYLQFSEKVSDAERQEIQGGFRLLDAE